MALSVSLLLTGCVTTRHGQRAGVPPITASDDAATNDDHRVDCDGLEPAVRVPRSEPGSGAMIAYDWSAAIRRLRFTA
jgi:hypothetical protein